MKLSILKKIKKYFISKSKSFIYKFAFCFFLCNLILILIANTIFYQNTVKIILNSSYQYTYAIMEQARSNFDTYLSSHSTILNSIAENDQLLSVSQCYEQGDINNTYKYETRIVDSIKEYRENHPDIMDVVVIMDNGLLINREAGWGLKSGYPFLKTDWYRDAMQYERGSPSNIFYMKTDFYQDYSSNQNQPVVTISQPVYNYLQEKIGAVFYMIYLDSFWTSVLNGYHSQYGDIVLTNQDNIIIANSKVGLEGTAFPNIEDAVIADAQGKIENQNPSHSILLLPSTNSACNVLCSINVDIKKETSQLLQCITIIVALSVLLNVIVTLYISRKLNHPVQSLVTDMRQLTSSPPNLLEGNYQYSELKLIADNFNVLLHDIYTLNTKQTKMQITLEKAKNDALISKINPHFLFNTLQLIQTENYYGSREKTNNTILSLSNQLRYNIYDDSSNIIPLSQELKRIEEYLGLCAGIYEDNLDTKIEIPDGLKCYSIPKFTLYVLVENSIKHGFQGTPENAFIHISAKDIGSVMELSVTDNGQGLSPEKLSKLRSNLKNGTHSGIGLQNLTKQMEFIYGNDYYIDITSDTKTTCVSIRIPCCDAAAI